MIHIEKLSYAISGKEILTDVNITIPTNQLTAIIGPNGAGKSTLLNIMARLLPLQSGEVRYDDISIGKTSDAELAKVLAILSQQSLINSRITVAELLMFGRYPHHHGRPTATDKEVVNQRLAQFDLLEMQNRYIDSLSGGQRQRALIAMTFCQSTPYILLDEPLNNLDLYHAHQLMTLIRNTTEEQTVVIVLHDINHAIAFADNIIAMKDGTVAYHGTPREIITRENIKVLFNVDVDIIEHQGKVRMI